MSIAFHFGLTIAIIVATLFTTYILYVLIKEKRFGWLITIFIMVVLPVIITYFVSKGSLFSVMAIILIPFSLFYLYCFLLRYALDDWIEECEGKIELEEEKENESKKIKKADAVN
jgi:predicted neutral ceramidase superfamily lipid hydrolase